jgi:hypothetical protein
MWKARRVGVGCLGLVLVSGIVFAFTGPGQAFIDLWQNGAIQAIVTKPPQRKYSASSEEHLRALHTALMLYHESEGQFPEGSGWMEAIANRLEANDLKKDEAAKKLIRPDLAGSPGSFGYALNQEASARYQDDVPSGTAAILVYESLSTRRNAAGDPTTDRDGMAITIEGKILQP